MNKIERNSIVTLHHQIGYTDGHLLEDSFDDDPMTVRLGSGELAEGLELALLGLQAGDEQSLDIGPDLAFGYPDEAMIQQLPRTEFSADLALESGLIIEFSTPNGDTLPGPALHRSREWSRAVCLHLGC